MQRIEPPGRVAEMLTALDNETDRGRPVPAPPLAVRDYDRGLAAIVSAVIHAVADSDRTQAVLRGEIPPRKRRGGPRFEHGPYFRPLASGSPPRP